MRSIKTEYSLTQHAYERFRQRVGKGNNKDDALNWIAQAISNSVFVRQTDGYRYYKYGEYKIVVGEENKVVTISYFNDSHTKEFKKEVNKMIRAKFKAKLQPFYRAKKSLQIEVYEAKIRQLKAKNPKTQAIIQEEISELETQLIRTIASIDEIIKLGQHFNVPPNMLERS
ncbi:hypothetical protein [Staphylococcus sp. Mo2-1]